MQWICDGQVDGWRGTDRDDRPREDSNRDKLRGGGREGKGENQRKLAPPVHNEKNNSNYIFNT